MMLNKKSLLLTIALFTISLNACADSSFVATSLKPQTTPGNINAPVDFNKILDSETLFNNYTQKYWSLNCLNTENVSTNSMSKNISINISLLNYLEKKIYAQFLELKKTNAQATYNILNGLKDKKIKFKCEAGGPNNASDKEIEAISQPQATSPTIVIKIHKYEYLSRIPLLYFEKLNNPSFDKGLFNEFVALADTPASQSSDLKICSFNIQFLSFYKLRDQESLVNFIKENSCDMLVVQELVAPPDLRLVPSSPYSKNKAIPRFPDGAEIKPNDDSTEFFILMHNAGYDGFVLSEEDTGNIEKNQNNSTSTEWFVTFYKTSHFSHRIDLPNGFLHEDRTKNEFFDRVPYATSFATNDGRFDFTLINVHLHPNKLKRNLERRKVELTSIFNWIAKTMESTSERDFIILGDMNIEDNRELTNILQLESPENTPAGFEKAFELKPKFVSLNKNAAINTNTNVKNPKPYDHVLLDPQHTSEIPAESNFHVLDLLVGMKKYWRKKEPYPGEPTQYDHESFRQHFSDHHPVSFTVRPGARDDD